MSLSSRWTIPGRHGSPPAAPRAARQLRERSVRVTGSRVHHEAGGLVDNEHVGILVDDRECHGLPRIRRRRGGQLNDDPLAAREHARLRCHATGDAYGAELDPARCLCARAGMRREIAVEPLSRGLRWCFELHRG